MITPRQTYYQLLLNFGENLPFLRYLKAVNKYFWTFSFTLGYIFLLFYSKWVSKHYNKILSQAEELLKELAF